MSRILTSLVAAAAIAAPSLAFAADWNVDSSHTAAQFAVRHMMISTVRGEFSKLQGTVHYDPAAPETLAIDATIEAASIDTREPKRDAHLRSADFFDVAKYPTITFKSKSAKKLGAGKLAVTGDLTMHGVTKPVTLEVTGLDKEMKDPYGMTRLGGSATGKINRKDFGLAYNAVLEAGGVAISEEVELTLDIELVKKVDAATAAK